MSEPEILEVRILRTERWLNPRAAVVKEVTYDDGRIRYHVDVTDKGRLKPFVHQEFSDAEAAYSFLEDKMMKHAVTEVRT